MKRWTNGRFKATVHRVVHLRDMPRYSVYSEEADGLAETARFLRKLDWEPIALTAGSRRIARAMAMR